MKLSTPLKRSLSVFIIGCTLVFLCLPVMAAPSFPEQTETSLQDPVEFFSEENRQSLQRLLNQQDWNVTLTTAEEMAPLSSGEYAKRLFERYEMQANEMLLVFAEREKSLGIWPGEALIDAGVDQSLIQRKKEYFFDPYANRQEYVQGIRMFLQETYKENEEAIQGLADQSGAESVNPSDAGSSPSGWMTFLFLGGPWLVIVLIVFLALIVLMGIYGLLRRHRMLHQLDQVDEWVERVGHEVNTLPVRGQLNDVNGQTKESIEHILQKMQDIIQVRLPNVETELLEIEEACDRFRFIKAGKILQQVEEQLHQVEQDTEQIKKRLAQIQQKKDENDQIWTEEQREFQRLQKRLDEYRITYGFSFYSLKEKLAESQTIMQQIQEQDPLTDPLKWNEWLHQLKEKNERIQHDVKPIPDLHKALFVELEKELNELQTNIEAFEASGYDTPRQEITIPELFEQCRALQNQMQEGELAGVYDGIEDIRERIEGFYRSMENEVMLRKKINKHLETLPQRIEEIRKDKHDIFHQFQTLSEKYRVDDQDLIRLSRQVDAECETLAEEVQALNQSLQEEGDWHRGMETLNHLIERTDEMEQKRQEMGERIQDMQKEERHAREQAVEIRRHLTQIQQTIKRSTLPGVPEPIQNGRHMLEDELEEAEALFDETPLNTAKLTYVLNDLKSQVDELDQGLKESMEQCEQAESLIQYANRYRSRNVDVNNRLVGAEVAFRHLDFPKALSLAEEAVSIAENTK